MARGRVAQAFPLYRCREFRPNVGEAPLNFGSDLGDRLPNMKAIDKQRFAGGLDGPIGDIGKSKGPAKK